MLAEWLGYLPTINACFNAASAALVLMAWAAIRRGNRRGHIAGMAAAILCSTFFLVGYITYHAVHGTTRFEGPDLVRSVYLMILLTHTLLAASVPLLVLAVVGFAIRGRYERHKRLARIALPIWLYVSITGVIIYVMLCHVAPRLP